LIGEGRASEHFVNAGLACGGDRVGVNVRDKSERPDPARLGIGLQLCN
jgi:hypothetical protein